MDLQVVGQRDGFLALGGGPNMVVVQHPLGGGGAWDEEGGPGPPVGAPVLHVIGHRVAQILQVHPAPNYQIFLKSD